MDPLIKLLPLTAMMISPGDSSDPPPLLRPSFDPPTPHSWAGLARPSSNGVMDCRMTFPCNIVSLSPKEVSPMISSVGRRVVDMAMDVAGGAA